MALLDGPLDREGRAIVVYVTVFTATPSADMWPILWMPWITVINYHHARNTKHGIQGTIEKLVQIPDIPWLLELSLQGGNVSAHSWSPSPLSLESTRWSSSNSKSRIPCAVEYVDNTTATGLIAERNASFPRTPVPPLILLWVLRWRFRKWVGLDLLV